MQNLIDEPVKSGSDKDSDEADTKPKKIIRSAVDLMRLKVEKLMKNPEKPIIIPEQPKEKDFMQTVPTFVRNVMGSSAGAGSGEFHVYRHLRRKEYARQKSIHAKSIREQLDDDYRQKLENNRLNSEKKTAKKRAKRLKKKERAKKRKLHGGAREKNAEKKDITSEEEMGESDSENDENAEKEEQSAQPDNDSNKNTELEKTEQANPAVRGDEKTANANVNDTQSTEESVIDLKHSGSGDMVDEEIKGSQVINASTNFPHENPTARSSIDSRNQADNENGEESSEVTVSTQQK